MKVLITGGAGYIGSVLTYSLLWESVSSHRFNKIKVADSLLYGGESLLPAYHFSETRLHGTDFRSKRFREGLDDFRPDAVVHLAALVGEALCKSDPEEAKAVNTSAVLRLLHWCRESKVSHFILASTCSIYGKNTEPGMVDESAVPKPQSHYALTKLEAEAHALMANSGDLSTTVLRFATAYGLSPRMRFDTLLNQFALEAWRDHRLEVYNPSAWRPLVHVRDIARAVSLVLSKREETAGQIYNVGGHNVTKIDLAMVLKELIPDLEIVTKETGPDARDYRVNFGKILKLGFRPMYHPADGLREVVEALEQGVFLNPGDERWRNA